MPLVSVKGLDFGLPAKAERDCQAGIDAGVNSDSLNPFSHKMQRHHLFGPVVSDAGGVVYHVSSTRLPISKGCGFIIQSGFIIGLFLCRDYLDLANGLLRCVRKLSDGVSVYLKGMRVMPVAIILVLAWAR